MFGIFGCVALAVQSNVISFHGKDDFLDLSKIIRIFPRRTTATPDDALAFTTPPTKAFLESLSAGTVEVKEVRDIEKTSAVPLQ